MKYLLLPGFLFFSLCLDAQFTIEWQKQLGGADAEESNAMLQTTDGGYMILGSSSSNDGDVSGNHQTGSDDAWLVKLAPDGAIEWQKCYGGSNNDYCRRICQTQDGGYILVGLSNSIDGDLANINDGAFNCWVLKIDSIGMVQWSRIYGGIDNNIDGEVIYQTEDSGFVVAGNTNLSYYIFKTNADGEKVWEHQYGGSGIDHCANMCPTTDKGYILIGSSESTDGDVTGHHGAAHFKDYWVVKTDSLGILQWQKSLGGNNYEVATNILQTPDNGYVISGFSSSNDGDVSGHHGYVGTNVDPWVVKLSNSGVIEWQECFGGTKDDIFGTLSLASDGQVLIAGQLQSTNGNIPASSSYGGLDAWLVKKSQDGTTAWQARFGGSLADAAKGVIQTLDGGYLFTGFSNSTDGDITVPTHGPSDDIWVVKLAAPTSATEPETNTLQLYPNPATTSVTLTGDANDPVLAVTIADVLGRPLLCLAVDNSGELPLTGLPAGAYILSGQTKGGKTRCGKLIKI